MEYAEQKILGLLKKTTKFSSEALKKAIIRSRNPKNGDYMIPFSQLTRDPEVISETSSKMTAIGAELIKKIGVSGQTMCIHINTKALTKSIIVDVLSRGEHYGELQVGNGKTAVIEFSSPNIAKVFHAGHLRTTILGNFLQNLHKKCGYTVLSINYLGDWGKQFGLVGVGFEKYGSAAEMERDPIKHLYDVYVKINEDAREDEAVHEEARLFFKKMEQGDEQCLGLWRQFRELSVQRYKALYEEMNVYFDVYSGESFYGEKALQAVEGKEYVTACEDGSKIADLGPLGKVVLMKSNGSTLYITRDIAAAEERIAKYRPDKMIYVVASQQILHLKQLFKILEIEGHSPDVFEHVSFGMVKGMSTRRGTVVFLSDIIDAAQEAVLEKMKANTEKYEQVADSEKTSRILAMSTIIIQDFKAKRIKDYEFDMERNTAFVGDTGPYIQYTHCRVASIARNCKYDVGNPGDLDYELLGDEKCYDIAFALTRYRGILLDCLKTYEPSTLVTYLFQLCQGVNSIFRIVWVSGQPKEVARARLALYEAVRVVLADGMKVLGMVPLERM